MDLSIEVVACNTRPPTGATSFGINNANANALFINLSGNTNLGAGDTFDLALVKSPNVLSQGNTRYPSTRLTGEAGFNSLAGEITPANKNVWTRVNGTFTVDTNTRLGVDSLTNGELAILQRVQHENVRVLCLISADTLGGGERVCGMRLIKSVDNGGTWAPLDDGVNFTTRTTAETFTLEKPDLANEGDLYSFEIVNKESNADFNFYAAKIMVL